ncbi:hypothetical protein A2U01_0024737, partial [Trifolium medium]|nr:hypothetical protein [Trifolium medium]
ANKGNKGCTKKGKKKKPVAKLASTSAPQEDSIQTRDSDSVGDSVIILNQKMIPISKIQVVLNEGEICSSTNEDNKFVRIEAERLFHIGLNLGVSSNEERLQTLDRMVIAEGRDVQNNVSSGEEEGDQ